MQELGYWEKHTKGVGKKILEKFGFSGRGLGANEDGIASIIPVKAQANGTGLGFGNNKVSSHAELIFNSSARTRSQSNKYSYETSDDAHLSVQSFARNANQADGHKHTKTKASKLRMSHLDFSENETHIPGMVEQTASDRTYSVGSRIKFNMMSIKNDIKLNIDKISNKAGSINENMKICRSSLDDNETQGNHHNKKLKRLNQLYQAAELCVQCKPKVLQGHIENFSVIENVLSQLIEVCIPDFVLTFDVFVIVWNCLDAILCASNLSVGVEYEQFEASETISSFSMSDDKVEFTNLASNITTDLKVKPNSEILLFLEEVFLLLVELIVLFSQSSKEIYRKGIVMLSMWCEVKLLPFIEKLTGSIDDILFSMTMKKVFEIIRKISPSLELTFAERIILPRVNRFTETWNSNSNRDFLIEYMVWAKHYVVDTGDMKSNISRKLLKYFSTKSYELSDYSDLYLWESFIGNAKSEDIRSNILLPKIVFKIRQISFNTEAVIDSDIDVIIKSIKLCSIDEQQYLQCELFRRWIVHLVLWITSMPELKYVRTWYSEWKNIFSSLHAPSLNLYLKVGLQLIEQTSRHQGSLDDLKANISRLQDSVDNEDFFYLRERFKG